jgi:hypothetical protein
MENTNNSNDLIICSYCNIEFNSLTLNLEIPFEKEEKFNQILKAILQTKLFCLKCSRYHTSIICVNSQILFPR